MKRGMTEAEVEVGVKVEVGIISGSSFVPRSLALPPMKRVPAVDSRGRPDPVLV